MLRPLGSIQRVNRGYGHETILILAKADFSQSLALLLLLSLSACTLQSVVAHPEGWKDPAIALQDCIPVERAIGKNPLSDAANDFALVTMYREKHGEPAKAPDNALYLVKGVLLDQEHQAQVVYFSALIVNVSREDHELRRVSNWVLADTKSDGKLDKAIYREKMVTSSGDETVDFEAQATSEQIAILQAYYEEAIRKFNSKANSELPESCNLEGVENRYNQIRCQSAGGTTSALRSPLSMEDYNGVFPLDISALLKPPCNQPP